MCRKGCKNGIYAETTLGKNGVRGWEEDRGLWLNSFRDEDGLCANYNKLHNGEELKLFKTCREA
jgi:hypothetical protein